MSKAKHKTRPPYLKWVFTDHYFNNKQGVLKFLGTLMGIVMGIYMPGPVLEEWNSGFVPIWPVIGIFIATYGFLIGIILQPYSIYRRLTRLKWWERSQNW